jgi:hypothetical protein
MTAFRRSIHRRAGARVPFRPLMVPVAQGTE